MAAHLHPVVRRSRQSPLGTNSRQSIAGDDGPVSSTLGLASGELGGASAGSAFVCAAYSGDRE